MSELTITVIRIGLLVLLWAFIFSIVGVLRGDLYGLRAPRTEGRRAPARAEADRRPPRAVRRGPTHLAVIEGSMRGISVPLSEGGVLIGRNPECVLVLSDDFASGRHARVYRDGDGWFVDDLGSTNGTFIGDQPIGQHVPLREGSRIRIGQTVLEVRK
ncbi:FHA domain-containing protein [Dermatophilaceae bacterium Sec6.4]|nr:FHA domain-containing protein [Actinomycetota bacterium]